MKTYISEHYSVKNNGVFSRSYVVDNNVKIDIPSQIVTIVYENEGILMRTHMVSFGSNGTTKEIENIQETEICIGAEKNGADWILAEDGTPGNGSWTIQVNSNEDQRTYKSAVARTNKFVSLIEYQTTGTYTVVGQDVAFEQPDYNELGELTNPDTANKIKPGYVNEVEFYALGMMPTLKDSFKLSIFRTHKITV